MNINHLLSSAQRWFKKLDTSGFEYHQNSFMTMLCYQDSCAEVDKVDFSFMRKKFQRENPRASEKVVNKYITEKKKELIDSLFDKKINYSYDLEYHRKAG